MADDFYKLYSRFIKSNDDNPLLRKRAIIETYRLAMLSPMMRDGESLS